MRLMSATESNRREALSFIFECLGTQVLPKNHYILQRL